MRRHQTYHLFVVAIAFATILAGCGKPPQEDISSARAAVDEARLAEADAYAPGAMQNAEDALTSAMAEVQAQEGKFALMRSFDHAKELLADAKKEAETAASEAVTGKEVARTEAENLIREATQATDDAKVALETAPKGKGTRAEIEAMKAELEALSTGLSEAQAAYESGKYLDAKAKAQILKDKAGAITADIAQAKAKRRT